MYNHKPLTYDEFKYLYLKYKKYSGYSYFDYDIDREWHYYQQGRSWFAAHIDACLKDPTNHPWVLCIAQ